MKKGILRSLSIVLTTATMFASTSATVLAEENIENTEILSDYVQDEIVDEEIATEEISIANSTTLDGGNSFGTATVIKDGEEFSSSTATSNQYYVFTAPQKGAFSISAVRKTNFDNHLTYSIFDNDQKARLAEINFIDTAGRQQSAYMYCNANDKVYFLVKANANTMDFRVDYDKGNWASAGNESIETADVIKLDEKILGYAAIGDTYHTHLNEKDYFKIEIAKAGSYRVDFKNLDEGPGHYVGCSLLDSTGACIMDEYHRSLNPVCKLEPGTYYAEVGVSAGAYGRYSLVISDAKKKADDNVETATYSITYNSISENDLVNGTVLPATFEWKSKGMKAIKLPTKNEKQIYRVGYTFKGFFDNTGKKVSKITKKNKSDLELTAKWEPNKYSIKYKLSMPEAAIKAKIENKPKASKAKYNEELILPSNVSAIDADGKKYIVAAWKDEAGMVYNINYKYKNFAGKNKRDKKVTLYPIWEVTQ